jgi:endonuclease G
MKNFETILKQTEQRFFDRSRERNEKAKLIREGKIFQANPPELVEHRLSRLSADSRTTMAIVSEGLKFKAAEPGDFPVAAERVLGTNDLMSIGFFEKGLATSHAVARIQIKTAQGNLAGYGTGFLVSPRLLLTNNHVFESAEAAAASLAEFNYQVSLDGRFKTSRVFPFAPEDFFLTDPALDYTLVALRPDPGLAGFGWLRLIEESGKLMVGEWVNIIQHPNGEPKQLAIRENRVVDELEQFLHYVTDTAPGSSGSPVFNDQWEVVALHHSGVPERDPQGNILTTDGRRWEPWMGEHRIAWKANEGARASRLVAHIKNQRLDAAWQRLRAEMFEAAPPVSPLVPEEGPTPREIDKPGLQPEVNKDGGMTVTIPLRINISLGGAVSFGTAPTPEQPPKTAPAARPGEDAALREALNELALAETRAYYDAEADARAADEYYAGIPAGISGTSLFEKLNQLLRSTHRNRIAYKPARHVYPWVDLHPDRKIRSIYSGQVFEPETLIREDFRIDREREAKMREFFLKEASPSPERIAEELDLLESQAPYNCEHVVPQSWFNKREPMRGDLHHLFACETRCNSFRSNIPYYDFPDFEEAVMDMCGKRLGDDKFEPLGGKGAVARASLYFMLRYPGEVGDKDREMQADRLPTLLAWHKANPPDEYEKHRNMAIHDKQGNRNPLIDRPEWAQNIEFTLGVS